MFSLSHKHVGFDNPHNLLPNYSNNTKLLKYFLDGFKE